MMTVRFNALIVLGVVIGVTFGAVPLATAQAVSVTAASPWTAAQGTSNLTVTISGKNFRAGATVTFYKTDTNNTGGVVVTKTTYKRSSQLIAIINVPETAERGSYDIKVMTGGGEATGRALFTVTPKPIDRCTSEQPVPTTGNTSTNPEDHGFRDATFGFNGVVIGPKFTEIRGTAIQKVGDEEMIVAVGSRYDTCASTGREWMILRYRATGEPDESFGQNGVVTKRFERSAGWLYGVATDSKGRIVVVGYLQGKQTGNIGVVARYTATGELDTTFATTGIEPGIRSLSLERYMTSAHAVAIQSDGKIVVAGTDGGVMAVFRLNDDGTLDTTGFNRNAEFPPQLPGRYVYTLAPSYALGVAIQIVDGQERVVVAGRASVIRNEEVDGDGAVWRFTSDGVPDSGFGAAGLVTTDFYNEPDQFQGVVIDDLNRIVVAGSANEGPDYFDKVAAVLVRYDVNGVADPTFDNGGVEGRPFVAAPHRMWGHYPYAIAVDADDNILVSEWAVQRDAGGATVNDGAGLWRFKPTGEVDETFGPGGWVFDTIAGDGSYAQWSALAVQADGKIIAAGNFSWGAPYPALARFWK